MNALIRTPKFYNFRQNNSGGSFCGPAHVVIVEACSSDEANAIAECHDVYFNGCATGADCSCCGDRWNTTWGDPTDRPEIYGTPVAECTPGTCANKDIPTAMVVYLNGDIQFVGGKHKPKLIEPKLIAPIDWSQEL
jgi:hypothetical protein